MWAERASARASISGRSLHAGVHRAGALRMQSAAAASGAAGDASRFEDASENEEVEVAPAASAAGERASGDAAAAEDDDAFSDEEDEAMLAEALEWDFCEGAPASVWCPEAAERAH